MACLANSPAMAAVEVALASAQGAFCAWASATPTGMFGCAERATAANGGGVLLVVTAAWAWWVVGSIG